MFDVDDEFARDDLWILEDLRIVVDRAAGNAVGLEQLQPVRTRLRLGDGLDSRREIDAVAQARAVDLEFRHLTPLGVTEHVADAPEAAIVGAPERDESI